MSEDCAELGKPKEPPECHFCKATDLDGIWHLLKPGVMVAICDECYNRVEAIEKQRAIDDANRLNQTKDIIYPSDVEYRQMIWDAINAKYRFTTEGGAEPRDEEPR